MPLLSDISRLILIGGGLIGSMTMLAIRRRFPHLEVFLIGEDHHFGGSLIMPMFERDIAPKLFPIIEMLIVRRWPAYYFSTSENIEKREAQVAIVSPRQIHAELLDTCSMDWLFPGRQVSAQTASSVMLTSGERLSADLILDVRFTGDGLPTSLTKCTVTERDFRFDEPHLLEFPVLADAMASDPPNERGFVQYIPLETNILRIINVMLDGSRHRPDTDLWSPISPTVQTLCTATEVFPIKKPSDMQSQAALAALGLGIQFMDAVNFAEFVSNRLEQGERRPQTLLENFGAV